MKIDWCAFAGEATSENWNRKKKQLRLSVKWLVMRCRYAWTNIFCASGQLTGSWQIKWINITQYFKWLLFSFSIPSIYLRQFIDTRRIKMNVKNKNKYINWLCDALSHTQLISWKIVIGSLRSHVSILTCEMRKITKATVWSVWTRNKRKLKRKIMNYDFDRIQLSTLSHCRFTWRVFTFAACKMKRNDENESLLLIWTKWTMANGCAMICFNCFRFVESLAIHRLIANHKQITEHEIFDWRQPISCQWISG